MKGFVMSSVIVDRKAGLNKGKRRLWLEGKELLAAGFTKGATFTVGFAPGYVVLELDPNGKRRVSGKIKPSGEFHPIIDLTGDKLAEALPGTGDFVPVQVTFTNGRIVARKV
jgi:DNA (cytosine-5)-methyltransferase 1